MIDPGLQVEVAQEDAFNELSVEAGGTVTNAANEICTPTGSEIQQVPDPWNELLIPEIDFSEQQQTEIAGLSGNRLYHLIEAAKKGTLTGNSYSGVSIDTSTIDVKTKIELELPSLFHEIKETRTGIGDVCLYGSMIRAPLSTHSVAERQNAVKYLSEDLQVTASIGEFLEKFSSVEEQITFLLNSKTSDSRSELVKCSEFIKAIELLRKEALSLPELKDPVLNKALESIKEQLLKPELSRENLSLYYDGIPLSRLTDSPSKENKKVKSISTYKDAESFGEGLFKAIVKSTASIGITATCITSILNPDEYGLIPICGALLSFIGTALIGGMSWDSHRSRDAEVSQMWRAIINKRVGKNFFQELLPAVGLLDELSSLASLKHRFQESCLPTIANSTNAVFEVEHLVSTLLTLDGIDCVSNDLHLSGDKVTVLTGPNSGGKSTLALAIEHATLLGMMGGYVPAKKLTMSCPNFISHQGPEMGDSKKREGRFGYEGSITLARVRTAHDSGMNLIFIDEMSQGTNPDEALTHARNFAHAFHAIGGVNVIITQDFRLAKILETEGIAQCLQFEFKDGQSTHRVIPGIATTSRSEVVAERVGFHLEGLNDILLEKGRAQIAPIDPHLLKSIMSNTIDEQ